MFYRGEESLDVLIRASIMVQQGFYGSAFKSSHTVIATWDNVACEEEGLQLSFTYCVKKNYSFILHFIHSITVSNKVIF